ncbi:MAG: hypothetical protein Q9191_008328, partial [Dirinaria sp. TL-2023a]
DALVEKVGGSGTFDFGVPEEAGNVTASELKAMVEATAVAVTEGHTGVSSDLNDAVSVLTSVD